MRITTKYITDKLDNIPKSIYAFTKDFLIFDIETTGFSRENEIIYMIGCICKTDRGYEYYNIFAENPSQEYEVIEYFFKLLKNIDCVIHFNGNRFDIPFLLARAKKHHIKDQLSHIESIDVYDLLRPFRTSLRFPDLKLDTIQDQLGYRRKDLYNGGDLIQVYHNYAQQPYEPYYELLVLHNEEDVEGMINLLPLIDVIYLIDEIIYHQRAVFLEMIQDTTQLKVIYTLQQNVIIDFKLFSKCGSQMILTKDSNKLELLLPLQEDEKNFFFDNYKDYMYILANDEVMHKTIGNFIPAHQKRKAKKAECYVSHPGLFIPIFLCGFKKEHDKRIFKDDLRSKDAYVIVSSELDQGFYKDQLSGFLKVCKGLK
ncbi:MAG TPA: ribonuclease H-like domain-containing protein [Epulopiscium sp.]|nr:ribonuclease H-like domain-containing protein [Candidatus Epulonipiscium sp.]